MITAKEAHGKSHENQERGELQLWMIAIEDAIEEAIGKGFFETAITCVSKKYSAVLKTWLKNYDYTVEEDESPDDSINFYIRW